MADDPVREYLSEIGRKGGQVTGVPKGFGAATPAQRKANAKKAAETRWAKKKMKQKTKTKRKTK